MTFTAVVTAHQQDPSRILGNLLYQTRKPDEIIALCSDVKGLPKLREHFQNVRFIECENREDWGHEKRAQGVSEASSEWLGFFNADDSYDDRYLEKMLAAAHGRDAVFCDWTGVPNCSFGLCSSTSGNFIVRTDIARKAGYTDRFYEADGTFINRITALTARVQKVPELLYRHNA